MVASVHFGSTDETNVYLFSLRMFIFLRLCVIVLFAYVYFSSPMCICISLYVSFVFHSTHLVVRINCI